MICEDDDEERWLLKLERKNMQQEDYDEERKRKQFERNGMWTADKRRLVGLLERRPQRVLYLARV